MNDDGNERVMWRFTEVDRDLQWERTERQRVHTELRTVSAKHLKKYEAKAKKVANTQVLRMAPRLTDRALPGYCLDEVERLMEANPQIEVKVVRGDTVVVLAKPEGVLHAIVDALDLTKGEAAKLQTLIRRDQGAAQLLLRHLHTLGDLAVEYIKTGKRPKPDVGTGKANRVGAAGTWTV